MEGDLKGDSDSVAAPSSSRRFSELIIDDGKLRTGNASQFFKRQGTQQSASRVSLNSTGAGKRLLSNHDALSSADPQNLEQMNEELNQELNFVKNEVNIKY